MRVVKLEFDPAKSERKARERGLPFERAVDFDFDSALIVADDRGDYGERRWRALGRIGARVHALVFVETPGGIRVVSLRKANPREVRIYDQENEVCGGWRRQP